MRLPTLRFLANAGIDSLDAAEVVAAEDHDRIHILESCVVTWTKQIKNVLKSDPDEPLKLGQHPGPEAELNFWTERANNLNSIQQQLEGSHVQKVVSVLQQAKSTYFPAYGRLANEVAKGQTRANDNVKFLAPLKPRLEKLLYRCISTILLCPYQHVFDDLLRLRLPVCPRVNSVMICHPKRLTGCVMDVVQQPCCGMFNVCVHVQASGDDACMFFVGTSSMRLWGFLSLCSIHSCSYGSTVHIMRNPRAL